MIRQAVRDDASRIAEILIFAKRAAYRPIFNADAVSFNEMRVLDLALRFRDEAGALSGVYVLDDGIVRGMLRAARRDDGVFELIELYVDPFFQRMGCGAALLTFFETLARDAGCRDAVLWVLEKNAAGRAFYEKHGFAWDGGRALEEGTPEYRLEYAKRV